MSKFTNSVGGWLLQAMFFETTLSDRPHVRYTLKDYDHEGYPSLYRLYMETDDPTEYIFSQTHLGGWAHWERLCECDWFKPYVARWRTELELRFRANALKNIKEIASSTGKDKLTANKFLVAQGWVKSEHGRGRPSKDEIKQEANRLATIATTLDNDFERISKIN